MNGACRGEPLRLSERAGAGSKRNGRSGIRTIVGTHFALTSSRPWHTGVPFTCAACTREEGQGETPGHGTPLVRASAPHGVSGSIRAESHLGSTLNPGGAVLTLGVFRRSRSVACVRADASPSEVLAEVMVASRAQVSQARLAHACINSCSGSLKRGSAAPPPGLMRVLAAQSIWRKWPGTPSGRWCPRPRLWHASPTKPGRPAQRDWWCSPVVRTAAASKRPPSYRHSPISRPRPASTLLI